MMMSLPETSHFENANCWQDCVDQQLKHLIGYEKT